MTPGKSQPKPPKKVAIQMTPEAIQPDRILHNAHDVDTMRAECNAILKTLNMRGIGVRLEQIELASQAWSVMRILVLKGICTESEAQGEMLVAERNYLRSILQQVEHQQLTGSAPPEAAEAEAAPAQPAQSGLILPMQKPLIVPGH